MTCFRKEGPEGAGHKRSHPGAIYSSSFSSGNGDIILLIQEPAMQ